jgi:phosphinothricin acetyltransferase
MLFVNSGKQKMKIDPAHINDLSRIVEIYNQSISSGMSTADIEPVSVASRMAWFESFNETNRPLFVLKEFNVVIGWCGFRNFYGRPAYSKTVEIAIYMDLKSQRKGGATFLLKHSLEAVFKIGVEDILAFVFSHNMPSLRLFENFGFLKNGELIDVADFNGVKRSLTILQLNANKY